MIEYCHKMAKCASYAYFDKKEGKKFFTLLGYTKHKFIDVDGAQCHVAWNDGEMVLAFRGTEPDEFSDIKADLNAFPDQAWNGHGLVHNGFQEELNKIWDKVLDALKIQGERELHITGHSLGGAMATLATSRLRTKTRCLYTYGSPRVGTRRFVKSINVPHYRHVNNNDIVTKVPFAIMGYKHHGHLRYINHYGEIRHMNVWQRVKDQFRGRVAAWRNCKPFDGAFDHSCEYYVKYTRCNC